MSIDWMYHRKSCVTCKRARGFLDQHEVKVKEYEDGQKEKHDSKAALAIVKTASKLVVMRGKSVVHFDMKKDPPDDATLLHYILGPTGNLRAPTIRKGKTMYIGFNEEVFQDLV